MGGTEGDSAAVFWIFDSGDIVAICIAIAGALYTFMSGFYRSFQLSYTSDVKPFSADAHTAADRILRGISALSSQQADSVKANIGEWLQIVLDESFPQFDSSLCDLEAAFERWHGAHDPDVSFVGDQVRSDMESAVATIATLQADVQTRPEVIFTAHIDQELRRAYADAQSSAGAIMGLDTEVQKKYGRAIGHRLVRFLKAHIRALVVVFLIVVVALVLVP